MVLVGWLSSYTYSDSTYIVSGDYANEERGL